tara:strand:+ start:1030 stop:1197 length:168 start_codon:yes stop_codon:yes gene_type:complete
MKTLSSGKSYSAGSLGTFYRVGADSVRARISELRKAGNKITGFVNDNGTFVYKKG